MTDTSVRKIHNFASNLLKLRNIGRPRHEARLILSKVLKKNCLSLLINKNIFISQKKLKKFFKMIYFRCHGKPISRIYGVKEFYSRKFLINKFTLDPRPDSEIIIETIKHFIFKLKKKKIKILDLGTGTGCLLITLILELNKISNKKFLGVGLDLSTEALNIAKKNADRFKIKDSIRFIKSNWFENINEKFDIIISNPPYIPLKQIKNLESEVKDYDPFMALNGGESGVHHYLEISKNAKFFLNKNSFLCVEIYSNNYKKIRDIFLADGFLQIGTFKDLNGSIRNIVFSLKKK
tara:strand:- start:2344 stop:3222 length:879 start_codon:yes stop_codon:yes gene_type:complete